MGIKYTDLELRWTELHIVKNGANVSAIVRSELGFYDPAWNEVWVPIKPGPTQTLDTMALAALFLVPTPEGVNNLGSLLDSLIYGILSRDELFTAEVEIHLLDEEGVPLSQIPEGSTLVCRVPGRDPVTVPLSTGKQNFLIAAQATIEIQVPGYQVFTWTGPLVGSTVLDVQLQPEMNSNT